MGFASMEKRHESELCLQRQCTERVLQGLRPMQVVRRMLSNKWGPIPVCETSVGQVSGEAESAIIEPRLVNWVSIPTQLRAPNIKKKQ